MSRLRYPIGPRDHLSGRADAPLQLVEYGDFECPSCGEMYWELKRLQRALGDRLVLAYRHFPLTQLHPNALQAAEASEAAASQGRFWEMHDTLFENQDDLDSAAVFSYADQLGLELERFAREVDGGVHRARIEHDFMSGVRSGVGGTPGLFLNGELHTRVSLAQALQAWLETGQLEAR